MKKGFLLGGGGSAPRSKSAVRALAAASATMAAAANTGVDNLLAAPLVKERLAAGAKPIRIECDFVTCSQ